MTARLWRQGSTKQLGVTPLFGQAKQNSSVHGGNKKQGCGKIGANGRLCPVFIGNRGFGQRQGGKVRLLHDSKDLVTSRDGAHQNRQLASSPLVIGARANSFAAPSGKARVHSMVRQQCRRTWDSLRQGSGGSSARW